MRPTPRLLNEWMNFEYDKDLILEQKDSNKPLMMKGILQKAETLNQNGRVYPKIILEREIRNYQKFTKKFLTYHQRSLYGR